MPKLIIHIVVVHSITYALSCPFFSPSLLSRNQAVSPELRGNHEAKLPACRWVQATLVPSLSLSHPFERLALCSAAHLLPMPSFLPHLSLSLTHSPTHLPLVGPFPVICVVHGAASAAEDTYLSLCLCSVQHSSPVLQLAPSLPLPSVYSVFPSLLPSPVGFHSFSLPSWVLLPPPSPLGASPACTCALCKSGIHTQENYIIYTELILLVTCFKYYYSWSTVMLVCYIKRLL